MMRGEDGEIVATKEVVVEVSIRAWATTNQEQAFDWTASDGTDSEVLFTTVAEALADATEHFGG